MWSRVLPIVIIVASNCFYHICTKSMPQKANAFGALTVTYLVGAVLSAILFFAGTKPQSVGEELSKLNWTSLVLGLAIVGLEIGTVLLYRAGWKVSNGAMVANICLAVALLVIGALVYKETITPRQVVGIAVCAAGLFLIR